MNPPLGAITVMLNGREIGARIRKARKGRGWSRHDLARVLRVRPNTITNYEGGWRIPPRKTLVALAIVLRRKIDWILLGQRGRP